MPRLFAILIPIRELQVLIHLSVMSVQATKETSHAPRTVLDSSEKLGRAERKVPVFEENVFLLKGQDVFTGSDYRAIRGNQLLNHAGQTVSALVGVGREQL